MKISLSAAWDETKVILARDGRLLVAVALALLVLPGVLLDISMPSAPAGKMPPTGPWVVIGLVLLVCSFAGQLALVRLALGSGVSVREAIAHGFQRLLPYLGAMLILFLPLIVAGVLLFTAAQSDPEHPRPGPVIGLLILMLCALFVFVRLSLTSPVASAESVGPIAILQRSWALARGNWWRLFAFALLFGITIFVLLAAVRAVVGSAAAAAFGELKPWSVGTLLVSLTGQLVSAAIYVIFFVMLARMYRQVAGGADGAAVETGVPKSGM